MFGEIVTVIEIVALLLLIYFVVVFVVSLGCTSIWKKKLKPIDWNKPGAAQAEKDGREARLLRTLISWFWPIVIPIGVPIYILYLLGTYPYRFIAGFVRITHKIAMGEEHIDWMFGIRKFNGKYWSIRARLSNEK